jgi:hypothetical protein
MAWSHAKDLTPHGTTAVSLTPGWLRSEMMLEAYGVTEETWREATARSPHFAISETPRYVGRAVAALAADPDRARWNGQSLSSGQLAQIYGFTDLDGCRPMPGATSWRCRKPANLPTRPLIDSLRPRSARAGHRVDGVHRQHEAPWRADAERELGEQRWDHRQGEDRGHGGGGPGQPRIDQGQ